MLIFDAILIIVLLTIFIVTDGRKITIEYDKNGHILDIYDMPLLHKKSSR